MKKIAFLINSLGAGGAEKVLVTIVNTLVEKFDIDIEVILLEKENIYTLNKKIKITYLSDFKENTNPLRKFILIPFFALKLKKYIKKNKISVIQSHLYRSHYVNILAKILGSNQKSQIVLHGLPSYYKYLGVMGKINLFLIRNLFTKADAIIYISKQMFIDTKNLIEYHKKELIINNPYDLKEIEYLSNEKVSEFSFKKEIIYLISVGRLVKLKRQKDIIKTIPSLPWNVELIILGNGEEKENLKKLTKKLGVAHRVHFLGQVKNPYKYIKNCHLLVHTSETEGFPNVIVEALACGVPVISSDCISGPREILYPSSDITKQLKKEDNFELGDYGILYPVGNIEALKNAIEYLLNNKDVYKKYKKKSIERAKDFSIEKIIEKYKKVLLEEI